MSHPFADALTAAVAAVSPSIVRVASAHGRASSGVAWSAEQVVTTARITHRRGEVAVGLPDGREVIATVVARDPSVDLAILSVPGAGLTPAPWGDEGSLKVGSPVLTLGRPGPNVRASFAIIAGLGGAWRTGGGAPVSRYIDVDGSLPWGFSGGPLVDLDGGVVGLNSRALTRGGTTLPAADVRAAVERLLSRGTPKRGWLGVAAQEVGLGPVLSARVGQGSGLLVMSVEPGSPADQAGVLLGDVVLRVGEVIVTQVDELLATLREAGAGAAVTLRLVRAGETRDVVVTLASRPA